MCFRPLATVLLTSCLYAGTWMSMFFPDPCAAPKTSPAIRPGRDIVLCAADECAEAGDRVAQICRDNGYGPGQGVPIFPVAGVMCLCPCGGGPAAGP